MYLQVDYVHKQMIIYTLACLGRVDPWQAQLRHLLLGNVRMHTDAVLSVCA